MKIEKLGEMASFSGHYINANQEKNQLDVDEFDFQLTFDILELHEITTQGGSNRWNKAIYTLTSSGQFNMQLIWDQELQDEIERLARE